MQVVGLCACDVSAQVSQWLLFLYLVGAACAQWKI